MNTFQHPFFSFVDPSFPVEFRDSVQEFGLGELQFVHICDK